MNEENALLAEWLGWKLTHLGWSRPSITGECFIAGGPPEFRTSNEWSGVLLDKLTYHQISLHTVIPMARAIWVVTSGFKELGRGYFWRDAVVDASLEIIRRDGENSSLSKS